MQLNFIIKSKATGPHATWQGICPTLYQNLFEVVHQSSCNLIKFEVTGPMLQLPSVNISYFKNNLQNLMVYILLYTITSCKHIPPY